MNLPLKYQVLETLTNACDKYGDLILPVDKVIDENFPNLTESDLRSVFAELRAEGLLHYQLSDGADIVGFQVDKKARSTLITIREEYQFRQAEKQDNRRWQIKWDIAKIALGYALGFISACLLK